MKKFVFQAIILLLVIITAFVLFSTNTQISNLPFVFQQGPLFREIQINNSKLRVEIADTQAKRNKGLGGRQSLAQDEGMLFIFSTPEKSAFWMKGLSFPLDFVWIRGDKVVDLLANVQAPAPGQPDSSLPIYQPKAEADKVLEVKAGTIQRLDIKVGDTIKIE